MNNLLMIDKIRNLKMASLKEKNQVAKNIYSVLISESCKNDKEPKDDVVISHIRKIINNNNETLKLQHNEILLKENEYLSNLLPVTMSGEDILSLIEEHKFISIAQCMKWFKDNYSGKYEGKIVQSIYSEWLDDRNKDTSNSII